MTDAVDAVGDHYSLPLVRELFYGNHRFSDLAALVGAPRTLLTNRLRRMEELGIVERRRYSEHPPRDEYLLTRAGRELFPVLMALLDWGKRHVPNDRPAERMRFKHSCGAALRTKTVCAHCGEELRYEDLRLERAGRKSRST
ncbi:MAG: helix-turn-helix transcriptional regulator [Deltaproteobacteria bacterium]|nr:helix-turn-helix transcriptional regulator [Deltaproteobacteria bacterium]